MTQKEIVFRHFQCKLLVSKRTKIALKPSNQALALSTNFGLQTTLFCSTGKNTNNNNNNRFFDPIHSTYTFQFQQFGNSGD